MSNTTTTFTTTPNGRMAAEFKLEGRTIGFALWQERSETWSLLDEDGQFLTPVATTSEEAAKILTERRFETLRRLAA